MTVSEMSDAMDAMLNSYANTASFGEGASGATIVLDEYEKSLLLTQAQDMIVKSYFTPGANQADGGFDDSERRQVDFSNLITVAKLSEFVASDSVPYEKYDDRSTIFKLDGTNNKILVILNEKVVIDDSDRAGHNGTYVVIPIHYREYDRLMSQDYAQPNKKQMWRLFQNKNSGYDIYSEIIPHENLKDETLHYIVRYVRRPKPIIVANLDGLQIDGTTYSSSATIEVHPSLHRDILQRAVDLAIATRGGRVKE